jgi:prevent-host-death family protein
MKSITATEASRNFSDVLDQVAAGEEIVITRGKKEIAKLVPVDDVWPHYQALIDHYATKEYFPDDPTWDIVLELINEEDEDDPEDDAKVYGISKDD